jgi:tight adherence protein C
MDLMTLLVFLSVSTLILGIGSLTATGSVKGRLERLSAEHVPGSSAAQIDEERRPGIFSRLLQRIEELSHSLESPTREDRSSIRQRLIEAGYRKPSALNYFMMTRLFLATALPALVLLFSPLWSLEQIQLLVVLGGAVVAGFVLPSHWVDRKRTARQGAIIRGLPDALDLMVVCVEAGLGIQSSLARIAKEFVRTNPVVSAEFELVTLESRAGKSTTEALRGLASRSGVTDVSSLVAMLVQTERFGTSLADTLRVQADAMRVARMQRAEEQAGKAPLKMMFPTIIIFAATLLVTLGPGMVQLMAFFGEDR